MYMALFCQIPIGIFSILLYIFISEENSRNIFLEPVRDQSRVSKTPLSPPSQAPSAHVTCRTVLKEPLIPVRLSGCDLSLSPPELYQADLTSLLLPLAGTSWASIQRVAGGCPDLQARHASPDLDQRTRDAGCRPVAAHSPFFFCSMLSVSSS